jgi:hypothetical protein
MAIIQSTTVFFRFLINRKHGLETTRCLPIDTAVHRGLYDFLLQIFYQHDVRARKN